MSEHWDIWEVAAAIMLREPGWHYYVKLTERILKSDLTGLTKVGGKTPEATVRAKLGEQEFEGKRVFLAGSLGHYAIYSVQREHLNNHLKNVFTALESRRIIEPPGRAEPPQGA